MKLIEALTKFNNVLGRNKTDLENFIDDTEGILSHCLSTKQIEDFISFFFG